MTDRALAESRLGTKLKGKWTLERLLGVGGMASVYVGVHKIGRRDAIKILHPHVAEDEDIRERFEREALAVNRFEHPGKVEIRDIDVTDEGEPFLVMELLEGQSLRELAKGNPGLDLPRLLSIVDDVLDVLAAAHDKGIIHRDVKPDNVFVQDSGVVKLLDFGVARIQESPSMTLTGVRVGTTSYMAPEQVRGRQIDGRVDIFALGATMFRLIAKRRIHEVDERELLIRMAEHVAPPLASAAPETPAHVCAVVDRALRFSRDQRYADARAMQADVRALREGRAPQAALDEDAVQPTQRDGPARLELVDSADPSMEETSDAPTLPNAPRISDSGPVSTTLPSGTTLPADVLAATDRAPRASRKSSRRKRRKSVPSSQAGSGRKTLPEHKAARSRDRASADGDPHWKERAKSLSGSPQSTLRSAEDSASASWAGVPAVAIVALLVGAIVAWLLLR